MKQLPTLMHRLVLSLLAVTTVGFFSSCEKASKLETDSEKASYSIGHNFAANIKKDSVDIDVKAFVQGFTEEMKGEPSKLKKEEAQAAMMKLQEAAMKKQSSSSEDNRKAAQEFLDKNKSTTGVKTTSTGLQYIVSAEGKGKTPGLKDTVRVHYKGTLLNGEVFDSSYDRGQPAEFPLQQVIPGWTEGIQLLKVGSKAKLWIPPELAYGPMGRPGIPGNSLLVFEIELLDILPAKGK